MATLPRPVRHPSQRLAFAGRNPKTGEALDFDVAAGPTHFSVQVRRGSALLGAAVCQRAGAVAHFAGLGDDVAVLPEVAGGGVGTALYLAVAWAAAHLGHSGGLASARPGTAALDRTESASRVWDGLVSRGLAVRGERVDTLPPGPAGAALLGGTRESVRLSEAQRALLLEVVRKYDEAVLGSEDSVVAGVRVPKWLVHTLPSLGNLGLLALWQVLRHRSARGGGYSEREYYAAPTAAGRRWLAECGLWPPPRNP